MVLWVQHGGTVISVIAQTILTGIIVYSKYGSKYALYKVEWPKLRDISHMLVIGVPIGVADGIEVGAFGTFFALISRFGSVELAASQIVNQIAALSFMPGFALSAATGSLVGRYMGSRELSTAKNAGYRGAALGIGFMGIVGLFFIAFPGGLVSLFTKDTDVIKMSIYLLRIIAVYQVFDAMNIVFRGALNGAGDTRFTLAITVLGAWCLFIPGAYLAGFILDWGMFGAWLSVIAYTIVLGTIFGLRFKSGTWQGIKLVEKGVVGC